MPAVLCSGWLFYHSLDVSLTGLCSNFCSPFTPVKVHCCLMFYLVVVTDFYCDFTVVPKPKTWFVTVCLTSIRFMLDHGMMCCRLAYLMLSCRCHWSSLEILQIIKGSGLVVANFNLVSKKLYWLQLICIQEGENFCYSIYIYIICSPGSFCVTLCMRGLCIPRPSGSLLQSKSMSVGP